MSRVRWRRDPCWSVLIRGGDCDRKGRDAALARAALAMRLIDDDRRPRSRSLSLALRRASKCG